MKASKIVIKTIAGEICPGFFQGGPVEMLRIIDLHLVWTGCKQHLYEEEGGKAL